MLNINRKALERVLQFLAWVPEWIHYSRRTLIPDESFFTSIIANDPDVRVCNDVLRYIKWPKAHAASGAVIDTDDFKEVLHSSAPFALKFDSRVAPQVLDRVDALLEITSGGQETCKKPHPHSCGERVVRPL